MIYQGDTHELQDTWLEDFDHSREEACFGVSKKGWTNEDLGLSWLTQLFEPKTRSKAGNNKRLLIVDGHSSHMNMKFIEYCDTHNILLGILPPHSTHRLQPLDVAVFSPLAAAYSNQIDMLMQSSYGYTRVIHDSASTNTSASSSILSILRTGLPRCGWGFPDGGGATALEG